MHEIKLITEADKSRHFTLYCDSTYSILILKIPRNSCLSRASLYIESLPLSIMRLAVGYCVSVPEKVVWFGGAAKAKVALFNKHFKTHVRLKNFTTSTLSCRSPAMSFVANSTSFAAPETYLGIYHEFSKHNVHLNIFERLWAVSRPFLTAN